MHEHVLLIAVAAALGQSAAQAETVEPIIVTAGRTGDPLAAFGGTAIDAAAIEVLQPASTLELLDRVAGARAFEKGGMAGPSYLSLRGGEPNFTLVLLDGLRVNDPSNSRGGAFDFAQVDPFALERIEIARGALSAVHGADALSGVVSLRLRMPREGAQHVSGRVTIDTRGGIGGSASLGAGWDGGGLLASGGYTSSGNLTEGSDLDRWQLIGRVTQSIGGLGLSALALHARTDRSVFPEDSGGPRLAVVRARERRQTALTAGGLNLVRTADAVWRPRLALGWVRQDDDSATPPIAPGLVVGGVPGITANSRFERLEATFENRITADEQAELAFGASYLREDGAATGSINIGFPIPADFSIKREILGGFAEATVRPTSWALVMAGLRFDDPSSAAPATTGRASLRLEVMDNAPALFASWSEGYKLPSLYALAYPLIANPALRPERSENYEAGIEQLWASGQGRARLAYFRTRYSNLIDFDPEAFTNVNRLRVVIQGVEAEVTAPISGALAVTASLTYLDIGEPPAAAPLRFRPRWHGLVAADWKGGERLSLHASAAYTSQFADSSVPTGPVTLKGRIAITAGATYRLTNALSATFTARNLLSDDYEDAVGFPTTGRVVRLGLAVRL